METQAGRRSIAKGRVPGRVELARDVAARGLRTVISTSSVAIASTSWNTIPPLAGTAGKASTPKM